MAEGGRSGRNRVVHGFWRLLYRYRPGVCEFGSAMAGMVLYYIITAVETSIGSGVGDSDLKLYRIMYYLEGKLSKYRISIHE